MANLSEHSARSPLDLSRLDGVTDPQVFDREYHGAIRDHLREGGFLPPTEGVTKDANEPEDTPGFFDSVINKVFAFAGSNAFEDPKNKYDDKRFDFIAGSSRYSETMFKDRLGRSKVGYDFNLADPEMRQMAKTVLGKTDAQIDSIASGETGISQRDARVLYEARISRAERFVKKQFEGVALGDNQRLALVSLAYQNEQLIGPKLTKYVKNGEWDKAQDEIRNRSNRYKLADVAERRNQEADMFGGMVKPSPEGEAPGADEGFSLSSLFGFNKEADPEAQQAPEQDPSQTDPEYINPYENVPRLAKAYRDNAGVKLSDLELTTAEGKEVDSANALLGVVPAHVRMVLEDVIKTQFGVDKMGDIKTSDFFNDEELVSLLQITKRSWEQSGKANSGSVEYKKHYKDGTKNVMFAGNDLNLTGGDAEGVIQKTLGQYNWRINDKGELIIIDQYDFNDAKEQQAKYPTAMSKMTHLMGLTGKFAMSTMANLVGETYDGGGNIGLYGIVRRAAALYGSSEGEGAKFEINLGKVDFDKVR